FRVLDFLDRFVVFLERIRLLDIRRLVIDQLRLSSWRPCRPLRLGPDTAPLLRVEGCIEGSAERAISAGAMGQDSLSAPRWLRVTRAPNSWLSRSRILSSHSTSSSEVRFNRKRRIWSGTMSRPATLPLKRSIRGKYITARSSRYSS